MADDKPITMQPVTSSFMQLIGHDGDSTAQVTLASGKTYRIVGMDADAFAEFLAAPSQGQHFNQVIKKNYTVEPVE